ncbi:unnamed protein product [Miscanthus lutarioriparius]|uniref:Uncharacterized protein n=1 Tax=Miscanthus lutarioriparius TaxID=422564 RepID=A0A811SJ54_9POAL|nr:unnamed protein product [Miscanthus lutarioriparius]
MAFFDQGDEEDDFDGVEQAARGVIPHVKWAILNELSNCKFLVVSHNGSDNYVDLWECGVPVMGVMSKRVLWAYQASRFTLCDGALEEVEMEKLAGLSDVFVSVGPQKLSYTNWYWLPSKEMLDLMVELRELNVKGAGNRSMMYLHHCSGSKSRMLKLRVVVSTESFEEDEVVKSTHVLTKSSKDYGITGATNDRDHISSFPNLPNWHILKTIIINGCGQFGSLVELYMSGTSIETLDLSAIQAQNLKRIFLFGCEKLRAILWPHDENKKIKLEVLRIDTTHITWAREDASKKEDSTSGDFTSIES